MIQCKSLIIHETPAEFITNLVALKENIRYYLKKALKLDNKNRHKQKSFDKISKTKIWVSKNLIEIKSRFYHVYQIKFTKNI